MTRGVFCERRGKELSWTSAFWWLVVFLMRRWIRCRVLRTLFDSISCWQQGSHKLPPDEITHLAASSFRHQRSEPTQALLTLSPLSRHEGMSALVRPWGIIPWFGQPLGDEFGLLVATVLGSSGGPSSRVRPGIFEVFRSFQKTETARSSALWLKLQRLSTQNPNPRPACAETT